MLSGFLFSVVTHPFCAVVGQPVLHAAETSVDEEKVSLFQFRYGRLSFYARNIKSVLYDSLRHRKGLSSQEFENPNLCLTE